MIVGVRISALMMIATLAAALVLTLVPVPPAIASARPAFYTITVLFWVMNQPDRFGLLAAWLAGRGLHASSAASTCRNLYTRPPGTQPPGL